MLDALCFAGQLPRAMSLLSTMHSPPSCRTYMSLLKACNKNKALPYAKQVHSHIITQGTCLTGLLADYLVVTLAKCGAVEDAVALLYALPCRTVISWTAVISAYADAGRGSRALEMFHSMQEDGVESDGYTFVSLFKACASIPDLEKGKEFHAQARTKGLTSDTFLGNTLISMYGKCGAVVEAQDVFCNLSEHSMVSFNAMLSAYVDQDQAQEVLQLYGLMQQEGFSSDSHTFMSVIRACSTLAENSERRPRGFTISDCLVIGRSLHADVRRKGLAQDIFIGNALVSMYGKCRAIQEAESVLIGLSDRDVVSWSAMLSALVEQDEGIKGLRMFRQMQEEGISPDHLTIVIAIQACATIAERHGVLTGTETPSKVISLQIGQALHADSQRLGFTSDLVVGNTLLSLYGKCRAITETERVFIELSHHDIVSWSAMLLSYVEDGRGEDALRLYQLMQNQHLTMNDVAFLCVLQACRQTGSLEIARQLHFELVSVGLEHLLSVAATLIHAYGSCASMVDAQDLFDKLPQPDVVAWTACIGGHGNSFESLYMLEKMKLAGNSPDDIMFGSALSACNHSGLVEGAFEIFESMKRDFDITPNMRHYSYVLDLLGRAGDLKKVEDLLRRLPQAADITMWLGLLGACSRHTKLELAERAFKNVVLLQPKAGIAYILMSNIYAEAGLQERAAEVEKAMLLNLGAEEDLILYQGLRSDL